MDKEISQQLFCKIGDTVEFVREVLINDGDKIEQGDIYVVKDLISFGWDLEKVSGAGLPFLRILNSEMKNYVTLCNKN